MGTAVGLGQVAEDCLAPSSSASSRLAAVPGTHGVGVQVVVSLGLPKWAAPESGVGVCRVGDGVGSRIRYRHSGLPAHLLSMLAEICGQSPAEPDSGNLLWYALGLQFSYPEQSAEVYCASKYLPKAEFLVIMLCFPLRLDEWELSGIPKRGFGLMFLSAVEIHALMGSRDCYDARIMRSAPYSSWGLFPLQKYCELSGNPCFPATETFPGDVRRLSVARALRVGERPRSRGIPGISCAKGVSCERERYSQVV